MMYLAIAVAENGPKGVIPERLRDANYLLIMDVTEDRIAHVCDGREISARETAFAEAAKQWQCQAFVSGDIGQEAFDILAAARIPCYNGYCFHAGQVRRLMYTGDLPPVRDCRG